MNKFFPGYYPLEGEKANELWENGVIMLDSSLLLGLFCIRQETAANILTIFEKQAIREKLWITYDSAWHYHKFVNEVILRQIESVGKMKYLLNQALNLSKSETSYPYFNPDILTSFQDIANALNAECDVQKNTQREMLYCYELKNRIDRLFSDHVGTPYEPAELDELYKQGEMRCVKLIPPGYTTSQYEDKRLRYHDFIVWQQMIKHAMTTHKNIIMCTARLSDDWFYIIDGDPVISNSQIVNEFQEEAHQAFRCYSLKIFLNECCEHNLLTREERERISENVNIRFDVSSNDSMITTQNNSQS